MSVRSTLSSISLSRRAVMAGIAALTVPAAARAAEQIQVVATTGMIADTARVIGGDRVAVRALMGPGVDPHAYRQTRSDIVAMTRADLVLWHGLFLEAQMVDFFADLAGSTPVVPVGEAVPQEALFSHDDYADKFDPHVWMDPHLWTHVIDAVAAALSEADPAGADLFAANAAAYRAEMDDLSRYSTQVLSTVPESARVLVSAHDAFKYFGAAHGFEVMGIQGISTESEAGVRRIAELVTLLVERGIGAVFVESSVSDRSVRALIEGAAARGHEVTIGGELFSDAMGQEGTYEGTYLGMIDHNVTTIARALGGEAPQGGWKGQLVAS